MKSYVSKTWQRILALFLTVVAVFSVFGLDLSVNRTAKAATQTYKKVTAAPDDWSGEYLIAYEGESFIFNGSLTTLDVGSNYKSVTITENTIADESLELYSFTIEAMEGGYAIKSASGKYIGNSSDSNGLTAQDETLVNTITLNTDGNVDIVGSGGAYLRFNKASNQKRFRYYKTSTYTSQQPIQLYKLDETACEHTYGEGTVTQEPTCTEEGQKTLTCSQCGGAAIEAIAATGHNYADGACEACGKIEPQTVTYEKVTSASDLKAGDTIIIVADQADFALGTKQNDNNRGKAAITKTENTIDVYEESDVQVITLETGETDGTFALNVGNGYLYAASSSANHLRTEDTLSANSSWTIAIADGVATLTAQGDKTRNVMQYYSTSGLFACYASASQKPIAIYKIPSAAVTADIIASVELTSNLAINFYVENVEGITVKVGETELAASGKTTTFEGKQYNQYPYADIKPQQIADEVTIDVYKDGETIATCTYSVKAYCEQMIRENSDPALVELCKALLHYGAAAQERAGGYELDNLANKDLEALGEIAMDTNDYVVDTRLSDPVVEVTGVTLELTDSITIKYTLTCEPASWTESMRARIYLDGVETKEGISAISGSNGTYTVSFRFASAADFSKKVILMVGDNSGQKSNAVQYSVKSYCTATAENVTYGKLVAAIYNYIDKIDAYVASKNA